MIFFPTKRSKHQVHIILYLEQLYPACLEALSLNGNSQTGKARVVWDKAGKHMIDAKGERFAPVKHADPRAYKLSGMLS